MGGESFYLLFVRREREVGAIVNEDAPFGGVFDGGTTADSITIRIAWTVSGGTRVKCIP